MHHYASFGISEGPRSSSRPATLHSPRDGLSNNHSGKLDTIASTAAEFIGEHVSRYPIRVSVATPAKSVRWTIECAPGPLPRNNGFCAA
jgi:hypothetical protein